MKRLFLMAWVVLILALFAGCADGSFHWITPEPVAVPTVTNTPEAPPVTVEPEVVPNEEVGEPVQEPTPAPPCIMVKGNISRDGRKLYHLPGMPNYGQVKIDEGAGEMWFCDEAEAVAAGWAKAGGK